MKWVIRNRGLRVHERLFKLFGWEVWYVARITDNTFPYDDAAEYEVGVYAVKNHKERWIIRPYWVK